VFIPKILRAFPPEICKWLIVHVKRLGLSEGHILKLIELLGEEVDAVLTAQKIRGETLDHLNYTPSAPALHFNSKQSKSGRKDRHTGDPFCVFCESKGHWDQDSTPFSAVSEHREKLKSAHHCFLCLNCGHNARGVETYAQDGKGCITDLYVMRLGPLLHVLKRLHQLPWAR